jgi:hypothetical protein
MSALRRFLLMSLTLAVAGGATYLVTERLDLGGGGDQVVSGPDGSVAPGTGAATTTTVDGTPVPAAGQQRVTGTVTAVRLVDAVLDPRDVPTPLTVVSERGFGNGGELTGVTVEGEPATVVWDGGRPFVLTSGGALVLDPVAVDLTPDGLRLVLGGGAHALAPGAYQLDAPVAVGTTGVASARDSVRFDATASSLFEARGDAALVLPPTDPRRFIGPGAVRLEGTLEVTDADGTRAATVVDVAVDAFELTLTPDGAGGWTVTATVQGEATIT